MQKILLFSFIFGLSISLSSCKQNGSTDVSKLDAAQDTTGKQGIQLGNPKFTEQRPNTFEGSVAELITDADFQKIFNEDPSKSLNKNALKNYALWTWLRSDWVERDNANDKTDKEFKSPKHMMAIQLRDFGNPYIAQATMDEIVKNRIQKWNDQIAGLGGGAVWSADNQQLSVLTGQFIADIQINAADSPAENLEKAKQVAAIIAPKLAKK